MAERIVVGMSGGVDSSVCAGLLKEAGWDVVGVFMRSGQSVAPPDKAVGRPQRQGCCSAADARDARLAADHLGIPFYSIDFEREFDRIIEDFVDSYRQGFTPNPCIRCNAWLKFGHLLTLARRLGANRIATGHYARRVPGQSGRWAVARARDSSKDQSYVLHPLTQEALAHTELPLGDMTKGQVRDHASRQGLAVADKPESQEICFTAGNDYRELVRQRAPEAFEPGELVDSQGQVLGNHDGIGGLTVGQRRGLGLAVGRPLHVLQIDAGSRRVVVGDRAQLASTGLEAVEFSWMAMAAPEQDAAPLSCWAQVRYHHDAQPAQANLLSDGRVSVSFDSPVTAVAPGQSVVLYDAAGVVLGGGIIASSQLAAAPVASP